MVLTLKESSMRTVCMTSAAFLDIWEIQNKSLFIKKKKIVLISWDGWSQ